MRTYVRPLAPCRPGRCRQVARHPPDEELAPYLEDEFPKSLVTKDFGLHMDAGTFQREMNAGKVCARL
jgi:hypothetical protein